MSSESDSLSISEKLNQLSWKLKQKKNKGDDDDDDEADTEGSDLEDFIDEDEVKRNRHQIDINDYLDNSAVIQSCGKSPTRSVVEKANKAAIDRHQDSSDDEDVTANEKLDLDLHDYRKIISEEFGGKKCSEVELRTYQAYVGSSSAVMNGDLGDQAAVRDEDDEDTSEMDASDLENEDALNVDRLKKRRKSSTASNKGLRRLSLMEALESVAQNFVEGHFEPSTDEELDQDDDDDDDEGGDETVYSDVEVTVKDYYAIRKETTPRSDCGMNEYILDFNNVESLVRVNSADAANSDIDTEEDDDDDDDDDDEDDDEKVAVKPSDSESESDDGDTESEDLEAVDKQEKLAATLGDPPPTYADVVKMNRKTAHQSPETDEEDIQVTAAERDLLRAEEQSRLNQYNVDMTQLSGPTVSSQNRATFAVSSRGEKKQSPETESDDSDEENDDKSGYSNAAATDSESRCAVSASLDSFYEEMNVATAAANLTSVTLNEREGLNGTIAVINGSRDEVFGIRFRDPDDDDDTEEFSSLSNLDEEEIMAVSDRRSPATENEDISDPDEDARMNQRAAPPDFSLPSPKKKIVVHKENSDGSVKKTITTDDDDDRRASAEFYDHFGGVKVNKDSNNDTDSMNLTEEEDKLDDLPKDKPKSAAKPKKRNNNHRRRGAKGKKDQQPKEQK